MGLHMRFAFITSKGKKPDASCLLLFKIHAFNFIILNPFFKCSVSTASLNRLFVQDRLDLYNTIPIFVIKIDAQMPFVPHQTCKPDLCLR